MIAKQIVTKLKTISNITSIFPTISAGQKFKMIASNFLVVYFPWWDPYIQESEVWPLWNSYRMSFMVVGQMGTSEHQLYARITTLTDELWVWCGTLQDFDWLRVRKIQRTAVWPIVYNQERPSSVIDFIFIV